MREVLFRQLICLHTRHMAIVIKITIDTKIKGTG